MSQAAPFGRCAPGAAETSGSARNAAQASTGLRNVNCAGTQARTASGGTTGSVAFVATGGILRGETATLRTDDFAYHLPRSQIAAYPAARRDQSRLLVMDRSSGAVRDARFSELARFLRPGSLLVVNDTQVIPARLSARKPTGGAVEVLLVRRVDGPDGDGSAPAVAAPGQAGQEGSAWAGEWEEPWEVLLRGVREDDHGVRLDVGGELMVEAVQPLGRGAWLARLRGRAPGGVLALAERLGQVPLPPYIVAARAAAGAAEGAPDLADSASAAADDVHRYQTVYARVPGAVAAPTAGLHFSPELLDELRGAGHRIVSLTLHVGPGTFRPVQTGDPRAHDMDAEHYHVPPETRDAIREAQARQAPIVAVGTTVVRALESAARDGFPSGWRPTSLYLLPGASFLVVTDLITNFHLPRSTLLMLVCAFAGTGPVLAAYEHAVSAGYRFYSYGDAMFLSPGALADR